MQRFSSVSDCHEIHIRRKDSTTARRFLAENVVADSISSSSPASKKLRRKKTDNYKRHLETVPKRTKRVPKTLRRDVTAFVETSRSSASEHKAVVNCRSAH